MVGRSDLMGTAPAGGGSLGDTVESLTARYRNERRAATADEALLGPRVKPAGKLSAEFKAFIKKPGTSPPRSKLYTPGPGSYTPKLDRRGGWGACTYSFGGSDRSFVRTAVKESMSPGPMYAPGVRTVSTKPSRPSYSFGHDHKVPRRPTNAPGNNPGPGTYSFQWTKRGGGHITDAPKYSFGSSSFFSPEQSLLKTPYHSVDQVEHENIGIFSPGPQYVPRTALQETHLKYSMRTKGKMEFDEKLRHDVGPGPGAYKPTIGRRGGGHIGDAPKCGFRKAERIQRPDINPKGVPFISERHAQSENVGIHSPGPGAYDPTPLPADLGGSTKFTRNDRFYTPFEAGRLA